MNKKVYVVLAVFLVLLLESSFAQSSSYDITKIVSSEYVSQLLSTGELKYTLPKGETQLKYAPHTPLVSKAVSFSDSTSDEDPSFVSESLHIIKKSDLGLGDISIDTVSKIMRSISKMKGMKYYSHSRESWDELYSESYMVENPDSKTPIADRTEESADGMVAYCYQVEHAFGECVYRLDYNQSDSEVSVQFSNVKPLFYKIIKAVKSDNMKINLVVTDVGDSYLVYMVIHARIKRFSVLEKRMNKSLDSRLDAIYKWFVSQF